MSRKKQIKIMKSMKTSEDVLCYVEYIKEIANGESYKDFLGLDNNYEHFKKLVEIGCKIAKKKADAK